MKRLSYITMMMALCLVSTIFVSCDNSDGETVEPVVCPNPDPVDIEARHRDMMMDVLNKQADVLMLVYRMNVCMAEEQGADRDAAIASQLGGMTFTTDAEGRVCKLETRGGEDKVRYRVDVTRKDSTLNARNAMWTVKAYAEIGSELEHMDFVIVSDGLNRWNVAGARCAPFWELMNNDDNNVIPGADSHTMSYADHMTLDFSSTKATNKMVMRAGGRMNITENPVINEAVVVYDFDSDGLTFQYVADGKSTSIRYHTQFVQGEMDVKQRGDSL